MSRTDELFVPRRTATDRRVSRRQGDRLWKKEYGL